jgi:hypothetical protein
MLDYKDIEQRKIGYVIKIEEEKMHSINGYKFFLNYANFILNRKENNFKHEKRTYIFNIKNYPKISTVGFGDLIEYCANQDVEKLVPDSVKITFEDILAFKRLPIEFRKIMLSKFNRKDFSNSMASYEFLSFTRNERPVAIKIDTQFLSSFIRNIYEDSEIDEYYIQLRNNGESVINATNKIFNIIAKLPYVSRIYQMLYEENLKKEEKNQNKSDPNFAMGGLKGPGR